MKTRSNISEDAECLLLEGAGRITTVGLLVAMNGERVARLLFHSDLLLLDAAKMDPLQGVRRMLFSVEQSAFGKCLARHGGREPRPTTRGGALLGVYFGDAKWNNTQTLL